MESALYANEYKIDTFDTQQSISEQAKTLIAPVALVLAPHSSPFSAAYQITISLHFIFIFLFFHLPNSNWALARKLRFCCHELNDGDVYWWHTHTPPHPKWRQQIDIFVLNEYRIFQQINNMIVCESLRPSPELTHTLSTLSKQHPSEAIKRIYFMLTWGWVSGHHRRCWHRLLSTEFRGAARIEPNLKSISSPSHHRHCFDGPVRQHYAYFNTQCQQLNGGASNKLCIIMILISISCWAHIRDEFKVINKLPGPPNDGGSLLRRRRTNERTMSSINCSEFILSRDVNRQIYRKTCELWQNERHWTGAIIVFTSHNMCGCVCVCVDRSWPGAMQITRLI